MRTSGAEESRRWKGEGIVPPISTPPATAESGRMVSRTRLLWSFWDCVSYEIMGFAGIVYVLLIPLGLFEGMVPPPRCRHNEGDPAVFHDGDMMKMCATLHHCRTGTDFDSLDPISTVEHG